MSLQPSAIAGSGSNPYPYLSGIVCPVQPMGASTTLTPALSGSLIQLTNAAATTTYTLPTTALGSAGLNYKFVIVNMSAAGNIAIVASANKFLGYLTGATSAANTAALAVACAGTTTITFVKASALEGDTLEVFLDANQNWSVRGFAQISAAFTAV